MTVGILYLMTGVGHFREALAIRDSLVENGHAVSMIDPLDKFNRSGGLAGKTIVFFWTVLFKLGQWFLETFPRFEENGLTFRRSPQFELVKLSLKISEIITNLVGYYFGDLLDLDKYSYIISTHPIATRLAGGFQKTGLLKANKIINVCVDEVGGIAGCFYKVDRLMNVVNSDSTARILESLGIGKRFIKVLGHPLDPQILKERKTIHHRVQESLKQGHLTLGLYIGCFGPESQKKGLLSTIEEIAPFLKAGVISAKILTGGHYDFEYRLDKVLTRLEIKDYIEVAYTRTPLEIVRVGHSWILKDINVMFSRPSELVFYSLATGIPHIIFPPLGPQEVDMLALLRKYAPIKEWKDLSGGIVNYLHNKQKLISISNLLFNSDYNFNGAINIQTLLQ